MSSLRHLVEAQHRWPVAEGTNAWPNNTQFGSRRSKDDSRSEARGDLLRRTIETEVIPHLLLAHRAAMDEGLNLPQRATLSDAYPRASEIAELARLVVHQDASTALTYVDTVSARGVPLDAIFINLLAPTARLLGELWNEDICSFVDVTIGLSRLQQVLHELSAGSKAKKAGIGSRPCSSRCPVINTASASSCCRSYFAAPVGRYPAASPSRTAT